MTVTDVRFLGAGGSGRVVLLHEKALRCACEYLIGFVTDCWWFEEIVKSACYSVLDFDTGLSVLLMLHDMRTELKGVKV